MNSPRVEMKLTHHLINRSQKKRKIFVLPIIRFTEIYSTTTSSPELQKPSVLRLNLIGFMSKHERAQKLPNGIDEY